MKLPLTIVSLGDSITNNQEQPSYVNYWQQLCDEYFGSGQIKLIAAGVNGETAYDAYRRLETDVFAHRPDLVTIMFGHNDISCSISPRVFQYHLGKIITACRKNMIDSVWLLTPNQVNYPLMIPVYTPYLDAIKSLAQTTGSAFVNIWKIFTGMDLNEIYADSDYLHPNETGHQLIADRLMKQLKKIK